MRYKLICCLALQSMILGKVVAQSADNFPPPAQPTVLYALETNENIVVDGKLTEQSWKKAHQYIDFFRMEPRQGGTYKYQTYVSILFDRKAIYVAVFCKDSAGKKGVRVQDLRRDFTSFENDAFYIQLDPQNLKRFCVSFQTTPYGNQRDLQAFDDTYRDSEWDALWKVRTHITDSGYYAEFGIPFKSLRYEVEKNGDSASWGITFARLARREYELTVLPAIPQTFSPFRMTYAAQLKGLKPPLPSANIRVQPYTVFQVNRFTDQQGNKTSDTKLKAGGEIKWAINPRSVLDLTFNTDFAQADVDFAVNNLTRFNVFFPEKRQFFLENSGVYAGADITNIKPFFSRSIGLSNTQFNADPVAIDAGARYTDRNRKRTIAGLYVHQRETASQPAANFGVFRFSKNFGKQNNSGFMITHRLDEANNSKGFTSSNNTTFTADGLVRPKDDITIQYLLSASRNNSNDSIGLAGSLYAGWFPNNLYLGWLTDFVDERYQPGMGYIFASNTIKHDAGGYYIWRPAKGFLKKWIRRWDPGLFVNWYQNTHNFKTQEVSLYLFPVYIITSGNGQIEYALKPGLQRFDQSFTILGKKIPVGEYTYNRQFIRFESDASRKISLESKFEFGGYYNGRLQTLTLSSRYAPVPHISFSVNYEQNRFRDFGENKEDFQADLYTAGIRLAANPRIQLSLFYQHNTFDQRSRWNVRGSWEFSPLSYIYLVFNESSFRDMPAANQSFISKLTYIHQF